MLKDQSYGLKLNSKADGSGEMNNVVYLLLGANLGNPKEQLLTAHMEINARVGTVTNVSSLYQSQAWGNADQPDFINQVLKISFGGTPLDLLEKILHIETEMGRRRIEKWGSRVIDIDILFFGDQIVNEENLQIPHPQIPNRRFTLLPLNEIAPHLIHPVLIKPMHQLMMECSDPLDVILIH